MGSSGHGAEYMGTQIEKTKFSMSIKFFFVFVMGIASALSISVFKHEAIGDITSTHAEKTANGIAVKASAAGDKTPVSFSGSGKCWSFNHKGGKHAKSHASGCTSHISEYKWEPVVPKCASVFRFVNKLNTI